MSCRVLGPKMAGAARPVLWPSLGGTSTFENVESSSPAKDEGEAVDPQQVTQLHQRIVDLEGALQREVRIARDSAFREGEKAGRAQAALDVEPVLERVSRTLGELASLRARIRRETEKELVALSIAIAKRVLHRELSVDPEAIQGLVKAALEKVAARDLCRVRLNPEHERNTRAYLQRIGTASGVELIADSSLPLGGVIVETRKGDLDASIDTQLCEIERGFADRIGR